MNLYETECNHTVKICKVQGIHCLSLRDMGFCENTHITKTREGKNIVCSTCGIRLALNQELAKDIIVDEL